MSNRCVCRMHLNCLKRAHRQWPQRLSRPSQALQCVAVCCSVHLVRCSVLPTGYLTAVGLFTQMSQIISGGFVERGLERFSISGALSNPVWTSHVTLYWAKVAIVHGQFSLFVRVACLRDMRDTTRSYVVTWLKPSLMQRRAALYHDVWLSHITYEWVMPDMHE